MRLVVLPRIPSTHPLLFFRVSHRRRHNSRERVVVAGGGVVLFEGTHDVEGERPEVVDAAAHAVPHTAPGTLAAAVGPVVRDVAVADRGAGAGLDGEAAAQPVAAVAAVAALAALGDVVVEGA